LNPTNRPLLSLVEPYIVFGNVANFGNGTSGPIKVHVQITSPQGAVLYPTDGSTIPDTLARKEFSFEFLPPIKTGSDHLLLTHKSLKQ
jgi:hypothetical protein